MPVNLNNSINFTQKLHKAEHSSYLPNSEFLNSPKKKSNKKLKDYSLLDKLKVYSAMVAIPSAVVCFISQMINFHMLVSGIQNKVTDFLYKIIKHSRNITAGFGAITLSTLLYEKIQKKR